MVHHGLKERGCGLIRNLKMHWRRMRNLQTLRLHGVLVGTSKESVPHSVRNALFKEVYEAHECELVKRAVRPQDRVLEIGAGIGLVSLLATRMAGEGQVLSCEANPALKPAILANYALNGWTPKLKMAAVTSDSGMVTFHQNENLLSSSRIDRKLAGREITVPSVGINELIADHRPKVIIMDVEGSETELLAKADLSGVSSIIVEMHPHIVGAAEIDRLLEKLQSAGFKVNDQKHKTYLMQR
jgi:FkbM family methyltransferase